MVTKRNSTDFHEKQDQRPTKYRQPAEITKSKSNADEQIR